MSLFGSTFGESYRRVLPHKIIFTETGTFHPGWTIASDYSANFSATLAMPVFKRLRASFSTTDNYLNNAPSGTQKNSYQFVTGITYSLHEKAVNLAGFPAKPAEFCLFPLHWPPDSSIQRWSPIPPDVLMERVRLSVRDRSCARRFGRANQEFEVDG